MTQTTKNVVSSESQWLHWTARGLTVIVAVAAAVLSFDALSQLAVAAGISSNLAWVWAVLVDGFILIATISVFALRKRNKGAYAYAFIILGLFVIISIIGNGLHPILRADELQLSGTPDLGGGKLPFWAATAVTAVPPVALFLAIHLITIMLTPSKQQETAMVREEQKVARDLAKQQSKKPVENETKVAPISTPRPSIINTPTVPAVTLRKPDLTIATDTKERQPLALDAPATPETPIFAELSAETLSDAEKELAGKLLAGMAVTGQEAADLLGVSLRTGQNKLKKLRQNLGLI